MFIYWCGTNWGKKEVQQTCYINEASHGYLLKNTIKTYADIKCTDVGCDVTKKEYGKNSGFRYEELESKRYHLPHTKWRSTYGEELYPQIDYNVKFDIKPIAAMRNARSELYTGTYTAPFSFKSIGLDEMNILFKYRPHHLERSVVNQLTQFGHTNIIPYRVIKDPERLVHKIQMWSPYKNKFQYNTIFENYEDKPEEVFAYMATFYKEQRDIEERLREQNVDYVYYDMDTYDLASVTGLEKNWHTYEGNPDDVPESYHLWKLDDPETKKRFDKGVEICDAFLKTTGLTDTRLDFRSKDGI